LFDAPLGDVIQSLAVCHFCPSLWAHLLLI
jgi:hypothetical protein